MQLKFSVSKGRPKQILKHNLTTGRSTFMLLLLAFNSIKSKDLTVTVRFTALSEISNPVHHPPPNQKMTQDEMAGDLETKKEKVATFSSC